MSDRRERAARWYAVQTRPRYEDVAIRHLANQGFETFCPRQLRSRKIGRHRITAMEAFFPGYLFVSLDLEMHRWRSINGTIGVLRLVGFSDAGAPAALPEGLIDHFRSLSAPNGELRFDEQFKPGDKVRVMGGPFDQLCGTLESAGGLERVTILLNLMSKETRVRLRKDMLVAA